MSMMTMLESTGGVPIFKDGIKLVTYRKLWLACAGRCNLTG